MELGKTINANNNPGALIAWAWLSHRKRFRSIS